MSFSAALYRGLSRMTGGLFGWLDEDYQHDSEWMNQTKALTYNPVWAAVSMISNAFAVMPLNVHREQGRNKTIQLRHPSFQLHRWTPNKFQTPATYKQLALCNVLLRGNFRAYIVKQNNRPIELIPMDPDRTQTVMLEGVKIHAYRADQEDARPLFEIWRDSPEKIRLFGDNEVVHFLGLSLNGVEGLSVVSYARQSLGIGLGAETTTAKQQKKGYSGGLMLEAPVGAFRNAGDAKEFLEAFRSQHEGQDKAGTVGLLREGIKANMLTMTNADAQFIEQRKFSIEDVERWFCMPGMLTSERTSYASLEQTMLSFRASCLAPWATKMEEECDIKLLSPAERQSGYYHKFNDGALLRTEKAATMAFISQGITSRVLSPNEAREMLDLNPYEGGDAYENPAVTPGAATDEEDEEDEEQEEETVEPMDQPANRARIEHLLGVEAGKVVDAAKQSVRKGKNYMEWLDDFYDAKWPTKLAGWFDEIGVEPSLAIDHCHRSKQRVLEEMGKSTNETLVANIEKLTSTWKLLIHDIGEKQRCLVQT